MDVKFPNNIDRDKDYITKYRVRNLYPKAYEA
jgi:hypothetical protein